MYFKQQQIIFFQMYIVKLFVLHMQMLINVIALHKYALGGLQTKYINYHTLWQTVYVANNDIFAVLKLISQSL